MAREHVYLDTPKGNIRTTRQIAETMWIGTRKRINHSVPVAAPLQLPDAHLDLDPYVFGVWLGDGKTTGQSIYSADAEIVEMVEAAGFAKTPGRYGPYGHGFTGLGTAIRKVGAWGHKHIPMVYLRASYGQRLALLQGLMDTDGTVYTNGQCEFCVTNEELAFGALELILSLGIKATMRVGRARLRGKDCGTRYRIKFVSEVPVFRLSRKLERQKTSGLGASSRQRYIVSVERVESVPVKCIEVDSPSHQYLCGTGLIPTHNSALLCGLAVNEHIDIQLFRREAVQLRGLVKELRRIIGNRDGFNSSLNVWIRGEQTIELAGLKDEDSKYDWQGRAADFKGFDEITSFTRSQYRFVIGWNRSTNPKVKRCRVVATGNPPMTAEGLWVIQHWAAWLDETYPDPAAPGELRWPVRVSDDDDEHEIFFRTPQEAMAHLKTLRDPPRDEKGQIIPPRSRTFIPAKLQDNPDMMRTGYAAVLDSMPKELREAMRDGNFNASLKDQPMQVIPTEWIIAAQQRWRPDGGRDRMMSAMAFDPAGGGRDDAVLGMRYGDWYAEFVAEASPRTADGSWSASLIASYRRDRAPVVVDVGGGAGHGFGGTTIMRLQDNEIEFRKFDGRAESMGKTFGGHIRFANKRAEAWWRLREALDPDQPGGATIALPPDPELRADLAAPTYEATGKGILVESKKDLKKRLGRSPGKGDACVMCWSEGTLAILKRDRTQAMTNANGGSLPTQANLGGRRLHSDRVGKRARTSVTGIQHGTYSDEQG